MITRLKATLKASLTQSRHRKRSNTVLFILGSLSIASFCFAVPAIVNEQKVDRELTQLLHSVSQQSNVQKRVSLISGYFLGKPYTLGPLGEGLTGQFDQDPLYRTDTFDCTTYVSTVLALSQATDIKSFKSLIRSVRYQHGHVSFIERNHFTSSDWNIANAKKGFIKDITKQIRDKKGKPIFLMAHTVIDKKNWYQHFTTDNLKVQNKDKKAQLLKLRKATSSFNPIQGSLPYLPLDKLFNSQKQANMFYFNQIPSGTIIEIVRPNWNLKDKIGTNLNVSHLGFGIRKGNTLYFREASQTKHRVIDIPLTTYLKTFITSPTVRGINVQKILDKRH